MEEFVERSITRKRRNRSANVINEELEELVTQYATEKVNYIESDLIKTFTTSINRNTLEEWGDVLWDTYDNEEKQLVKAKEYICFYTKNNKNPSMISSEQSERMMFSWLNNTKNRIALGIYPYHVVLDLIKMETGVDLSRRRDTEEMAINKCNSYIAFCKNNGVPNKHSTGDIDSRKLGEWFSEYKQRVLGTSRGAIYNSVNKILTDYFGFDVLQKVDNEKLMLDRATAYINFYKSHNRHPIEKSNDTESELVIWFRSFRYKLSKKGKHHLSVIELLTDFFKCDINEIIESKHQIAMTKALEYIKFVNDNNIHPRQKQNKNVEICESSLYNWRKRYVDVVKGKQIKGTAYDDVSKLLIDNYGEDFLK